MVYNRFHDEWHDEPDPSTPVTAEALEHFEAGIEAATAAVEAAHCSRPDRITLLCH